MNQKQIRVDARMLLLIAFCMCGCGPNDATITKETVESKTSRIVIVEESSRGENTYIVLRDSKTGMEYLYVDGFYAGAIVQLGMLK